MPRITLDASQWFKGASTSDNLSDGGFSPDERGISLFVSPGLLKPGYRDEAGSVNTNVLSEGVIAWASNYTLGSSTAIFGLSNNGSADGQVTAHSATSAATGGSSVLYGPDTGRNYAAHKSDLILYKGNIYWSSSSDVARDGDYDWWTVTRGLTGLDSAYPHYFFTHDDVLYFTDGHMLHSWDGTTATYNVLDLPQDFKIFAACSFNGMITMAATRFYIEPTTMHGDSYIFTWDGRSPSIIDQIPIHETLTALVPMGGVLYAASGYSFGYFNGSAFIPLYPLTTSVRKSQVCVQRDRILIAQGKSLLVYGNPIRGKQRFFSMPFNSTALNNIRAIISTYQDYVSMGLSDTNTLSFIDLASVATSGSAAPKYKGNRIALGQFARIEGIIVELDATVSASTNITVSYINSNGDTVTVGTINNTNYSGQREVALSGDVEHRATFTVQPQLQWGSGSSDGVRRIHIDYDYAEDRPNK